MSNEIKKELYNKFLHELVIFILKKVNFYANTGTE